MHPQDIPYIKICCISSVVEARLAVAAGASAIGLVSAMPSGPGVIDDQLIAEIAASVPSGVETFLLSSRQSAEALAEQHALCQTTTIQLVDRMTTGELLKLRKLCPTTRIVQVIHVRGPESLEEALALAPHVDALLLDSGNPEAARKQLGGTGRTHDWQISQAIREQAPRPVFLAGGLNHENVARAIRAVKPFGLDLCSGVRTRGALDATKLAIFMAAVRHATSGVSRATANTEPGES